MASAVDSSTWTPANRHRGTAMVQLCQRISTSLSAEQVSSGGRRWTLTVSPFLAQVSGLSLLVAQQERKTSSLVWL